jgi:thioredoxin reductase
MTDVGIIGAGRLGQAMARVALRAGRSVVIANGRGPESLTSIVGPSTRRKSTVESMFDQAQKAISGQLSKMRWGLGLTVPVPMCPFAAACLRRHPGPV